MDKKRPRKRKKRNAVAPAVLVLLVVLAYITLISPLFEIRQIDVVGNSAVCIDDIKRLAELETGQNILAFSASSVRNQINSLAFIREANVVREFPDRIVISVTERTPVANVRVAGSSTYLLIDDTGMVLNVAVRAVPGLPVTIGLCFANFAIGEYLYVEDDFVFRNILQLSRVFRRYDFFPDVLDMSDTFDIVLHAGNFNILFGGVSDADRKVQYIVAITEQFVTEGRGFIDIRDINQRPRFGLIR